MVDESIPNVTYRFPFLNAETGRKVFRFPFRDGSGKKRYRFPYQLADDAASADAGEPYAADAVHLVGHLVRFDPFTAVDAPTGFVTVFVKRNPSNYTYLFYQDDTTIMSMGSNGALRLELSDQDFENYLYLDANADTVPETWSHVLFAWDTGHAAGSRLYALYVNDAPVSLTVADDEGVGFSTAITGLSHAILLGGARDSVDAADLGVGLGTSIVEADNSISLVNRRKFIDADGKPANPSGWPGSTILKFVGDAASFATNQSPGGAFDLEGGALTNADTSPSD